MKLISVILTALSAMLIPVATPAQSGECGEHAVWALSGNTLTISGTGEMTDYYSPNSIYATYPSWYEYRDEIHHVVVGNGITTVGDFCFFQYRNLESVSLPEGIVKIGNFTFAECESLKSINIPETVEAIGDPLLNYCNNGYSFYKCISLNEITFPRGLKVISGGSFNECTMLKRINWNAVDCRADVMDPVNRFCGILVCGVQEVNFGPEVKSIPRQAFAGSKLSEMRTCGGIDYVGYGAFAGTIWQNMQPVNEVIYIDNAAYLYKYAQWGPGSEYNSASEEISIREGTKGITDYLFENKNFLKKITIPESVDRIGNKSFSGCDSLASVIWNPVEIQDEEGYNGNKMFSSALKEITFGNNVSMLPDGFLYGCKGLKEINLPPALRSIGDEAISLCDSITTLKLPDSVERLGRLAISHCPLMSDLYVGEGLKDYDGYYFLSGCNNLKTLYWNAIGSEATMSGICSAPVERFITGDKVEFVPSAIFEYSKSLINVHLGNSVKIIGEAAFRECKTIKEIVFPQSLEVIGKYAFFLSGINSYLLPENVKELGVWALGTRTLSEIISIPLEAPSNTSSFIDSPEDFIAYVPDEDAYKKSSWAQYSHHIKAMAVPQKNTFAEGELESDVVFTSNIPGCEITATDVSGLDASAGDHKGLVGLTFAGRYNFKADIPFSYSVTDSSGIDGVIVSDTDSVVDVYTIDGIPVLKAASPDAVSTLPAGIYILRNSGTCKKIRI